MFSKVILNEKTFLLLSRAFTNHSTTPSSWTLINSVPTCLNAYHLTQSNFWMSESKSAKFKKHSVVTRRRWRFESGTERRVRNYTSLFPSYLRSKTPKVTWTLTNAVISSFSDGLTGLLLEDKLIENLHVGRTCNIAEYCFCQYPRRKVYVCIF